MTLRCVECRTRRATYASMQAHYEASGHKLCTCGGLHYPHRPGTRYCDSHPMAGLHRAMRCADLTDEEIEDIAIELRLATPMKIGRQPSECPF